MESPYSPYKLFFFFPSSHQLVCFFWFTCECIKVPISYSEKCISNYKDICYCKIQNCSFFIFYVFKTKSTVYLIVIFSSIGILHITSFQSKIDFHSDPFFLFDVEFYLWSYLFGEWYFSRLKIFFLWSEDIFMSFSFPRLVIWQCNVFKSRFDAQTINWWPIMTCLSYWLVSGMQLCHQPILTSCFCSMDEVVDVRI